MSTLAKRTHYQLTFWVLVMGATAFSLLQSLVIPALPTIQHSLHTSQGSVTWVVTAYLLSASVFTPIMGRVGDMVGKERMLVVTLLALGVGSVVAALAHSIVVLIIGRAIQGIGGGVMPLSFGIIRDEFPPQRVATAIGTIAAMTAVGGGAGLVIAGPIVNSLDFHWLFWIPLIMIALVAMTTHLFVPESPVRAPGRVNWSAALLLSAWLVALLLAVSEAQSWGWTSSRVLGLVAGAAVIIVVWIDVESRSDEPLIDMRMMRMTAVWTNNLVSFLFGASMYSLMAFLPQFLQTPRSAGYGFGASTAISGVYLLPMTVMMFLFGMLSGRIAAKVGPKIAVVVGASASCAGYVVLGLWHHESWQIYLVSALLGMGLGLAFSAMSNLIVHSVASSQTGVASGMNANIRTIGGAIGASVMASIVTSHVLASKQPAESGYTHGFYFLAVVTLVAVLAALLIPRLRTDAPGEHHLEHAELALVPAGTLTEG